MSHFLARLVDRTRGTASRVEPVIPSRFAPTTPLDSSTEIAAPPSAHAATTTSPNSSASLSSPTRPSDRTSGVTIEHPSATPTESPPTLIPPMLRLVRMRGETETHAHHASNETSPPAAAAHSAAPPTAPRLVPGTPRPYPVQQDGGSFASPASPEPPIVRIHIGRIDVRATPAPASTTHSAPRAKKPALPLDEYLKARKDGAR